MSCYTCVLVVLFSFVNFHCTVKRISYIYTYICPLFYGFLSHLVTQRAEQSSLRCTVHSHSFSDLYIAAPVYTRQSQFPNSPHTPPFPLESLSSFSGDARESLCAATKTQASQKINKREKCFNYFDLTSPSPTSPHFSASLCDKTHWKHRLYLAFLMAFSPFSLFFRSLWRVCGGTIKLHVFQVYS